MGDRYQILCENDNPDGSYYLTGEAFDTPGEALKAAMADSEMDCKFYIIHVIDWSSKQIVVCND